METNGEARKEPGHYRRHWAWIIALGVVGGIGWSGLALLGGGGWVGMAHFVLGLLVAAVFLGLGLVVFFVYLVKVPASRTERT